MIERRRFVRNILCVNDAAVQAVHEDHNAERAAKIGGIHDDVGDRLRGLTLFQAALFEAPLNGFNAASVLLRELCISLLLVDVLIKKLIVIGTFR